MITLLYLDVTHCVSYKGRVENGRATHKTWRFLAPKFSKKGVYLAEVWLGDIQKLRGPKFTQFSLKTFQIEGVFVPGLLFCSSKTYDIS